MNVAVDVGARAVEILVAHQRADIGGCHCGWRVLGASYAEHVAAELRAQGLLRGGEPPVTTPARRADHPDFERQTVITHALPTACTVARLGDWREAMAAFLRQINAEGYDVVRLSEWGARHACEKGGSTRCRPCAGGRCVDCYAQVGDEHPLCDI